MAYIGSSPTKVVSRQSANIFTYTATANQTAFTGADANGNTLACSPSDIMVHMNGIKLEESDYTASTTTVTLVSGAAAGDEVTITAFLTFESADHYTKSAADTRYVNTTGDTMTGNLLLGSNSLGIGTASPAAKAEIQSENFIDKDAVLGLLRLTGQSNNENTGENPSAGTALEFYHRWAGGAAYSVGRISGRAMQTYDGGLQLDVSQTTGAGQTNFVNAINIDSNGHITTPNQPSFRARATQAQTLSSSWQQVGYDTLIDQRGGSNYSTSTGRFTAPVDGFYQFNASWTANNNSDIDGTFFITINNGTGGNAIGSVSMPNTGGNYDGHVISGCAYLSANDYVSIYRYSSVSTTTRTNVVYGGYFSGYLIG